MPDIFCLLSWEQPKQLCVKMCLTMTQDGNTMTQHKHCCLPRSYLHAMLCTFHAEALQILAGHRSVTVVSGMMILGRKKTISYIGLEKDVKWALGGSQFNNFGRCHPDTPCVWQRISPFTTTWGKGLGSWHAFPMGPAVSTPDLHRRLMRMKKLTPFNR